MRKILFLLFLVQSIFASAQNDDYCYVQKDFVIIFSSKDNNSAYQLAVESSQNIDIKLNLRNLMPCNDPRLGLTFEPEICIDYKKETNNNDSNCYFARGCFDDGIYISIEYSSAYSSFKKGYYIVIIGSGETKDDTLVNTMNKAKKNYKDALIKTSKVNLCSVY